MAVKINTNFFAKSGRYHPRQVFFSLTSLALAGESERNDILLNLAEMGWVKESQRFRNCKSSRGE